MYRLGIITGSTRPSRISHQLAAVVADMAEATGAFSGVEVIDLAQWELPYLDEVHMPFMGRYELDHTQAWAKHIAGFDAFIIVSPEYNAGYPAILKNAIDMLGAQWRGKPVGVIGYGYHGGTRMIKSLEPVLSNVKLAVQTPSVEVTISDDQRGDNYQLKSAAKALDEQAVNALLERVASFEPAGE